MIDCAVPPIDKACGEGLMPDSLAALGALGVRLPTVGSELRGIRFFDDSHTVSADFPHGAGRALRRVVLHELLVEQAERVGVRMLWGVKNVDTRRGRVSYNGGHIDAPLIVGADGQKSCVREEAELGEVCSERRRYGFRMHYGCAPWSRYVEIYWATHFQIYVTPVANDQVCVALISTDPHLRLEAALKMIPELAERLRGFPATTPEKGSLSLSRKLRRVYGNGYVLLGDASGSVDAITGEGMCLAFSQSIALVRALDGGDLRLYQRSHREIAARPRRMAALMLMLDRNQTLRRKAMAALAAHPQIFSSLLAAHVGYKPLGEVFSWRLLSFGLGVLRA